MNSKKYAPNKKRYLRIPGTKLQMVEVNRDAFQAAFNLMSSGQSVLGYALFPPISPGGVRHVKPVSVKRKLLECGPGVAGRKRLKKETRRKRKAKARYIRDEDVFEYKLYREDYQGAFNRKNFKLKSGRKGVKLDYH